MPKTSSQPDSKEYKAFFAHSSYENPFTIVQGFSFLNNGEKMKILITDLENIITNESGIMEDAPEFLAGAHEKFFIVLLTNGPAKDAQERVRSFGLSEYVDFIISAGDYEMPKPDSRIINVLLALLNTDGKKFGKGDVIMIGDKPDRDIRLANNAGVQSIRVRRGKYASDEPEYPDEVAKMDVSGLRELFPILGIPEKKPQEKAAHKKKAARKR